MPIFNEGFAAAIVRADPAAPINFVEEPIHDHQQDDDCEQSGGGLQIERAHIVAQRIHNSDRDEPGDQGCAKCDAGADCDRAPMCALCAGHARGNRGEYQNAFQSFAKNENADIEKRNRRARVRLGRIRRAMRGDTLPDNHRHHGDCSDENADSKNDAPRALALAQSSRTHVEILPQPQTGCCRSVAFF